MNDYIDRLISRSLNKSNVIQPRLPAIFEPQTNDEPVLNKTKVVIEPSYHSSKEEVLIAPRPEPDKQISSADPVTKSIKTGKNDLIYPDRRELEDPSPSLNFAHAKTEYPEEFRDTIADKNVPNENVAHEISFEPDNKRAENPEIIIPTNFIDQIIETKSRAEGKTLEKISDQPLSFSQKHSDQKNGSQNPHDPESSFDTFKGKLVTGSGIELNNKKSVISNNNLEQQESVIRVNIGRIEVRAVQPPTPLSQHRSKQFKPVLSLDDYLRQRNGDSR
jgi:hypothetical protein